MIDLHIHTDTPDELIQTLRLLGGKTDVAEFASVCVEIPRDEPAEAAEAEPAKTEAQDIPEIPQTPEAAPEELPPRQGKPESEGEKPAVKMEDARAALNKLRDRKGSNAVRELLQKHGVKSFIDLNPNDYATIIKEANEHE